MDVETSDSSTAKASSSWWGIARKPWVWVPALITGLATLLVNSNTILTNLRTLPGEYSKTSDQFSRWWHNDEAWTGRWTNSPEGYADIEDMKLTAEPLVIEIDVKSGVVDGTIATKQICDKVPMVDFLLLRGNVGFGGSAHVTAWDIIGGRKIDFAELDLTRDNGVMTVVPRDGAIALFPAKSRVAVDPGKSIEHAEFCEGKTEAMMKVLDELSKRQKSQ